MKNVPANCSLFWKVAALLQIHRSTLHKKVLRGEVSAFRVCNAWRFRHAQIDRWRFRMNDTDENRAVHCDFIVRPAIIYSTRALVALR